MGDMSLSDVAPGLASGPPPERRSGHRARERRRRRRRRRALVVVLVAVLGLGGAVAAAYTGLSPVVRKLRASNDYAGPGAGTVRVTIVSGSSGVTIAKVLTAAGVVKSQKAFVDAVRADPKGSSIQPGTYQLRRQMSAVGALAVLENPKSRVVLSVTIPEGKREVDILALLSRQLGLSIASLRAAAAAPDQIGLPAAAAGNAEGFLFPATYQFEPGVTAVQALSAMVTQAVQALTAAGVPAAEQRQIMIKASIVQAEAGHATDMGKVARVLDNRLAQNQKLQLDSTVSYATHRFGVTTTSQERAVNSPYNTYLHAGLPIGPIGNPGKAAIEAAVHPTPGPWMFFVTVNPDTGETRFEVTAAEHQADSAIFNAWVRAHPGT